ncbi:DUF262 domain-containing protein [Mogibacterium timidum]|uniref:DUF262 domain-containing protein n=1 Tax=Mogibacterium timidum TaxID=35519 RepID=UPI0028D02A34|nr:DUF262 domain-containing protein [Mogibacterium timidum]
MAYESPLMIAEVVKDISANKYVLPSIQREFVWSTAQIERLFDSVMQDYPFGAFLFWELSKDQNMFYDFYSFLQNYHEKNARHNPKINLTGNDNVMAVLDGQQRLTSLYVGLKGTYAYKMPFKQWKNESAFPERKLYLNIVEPADSETDKYEFSFLAADEVKNDNAHYWFEVGNILNMTELGDVMTFLMQNIAFSGVYTEEQGIFANATLSQLFKVIHTQPSISYYKVKSEELDKVLQIFIRVNSGGTVRSYSDLLLSIATAQWETLDARKEITEFVDYINTIGSGFNINKDFVLKAALVLTGFGNIAFKVDNFNKQNMLEIEQNWQTIKTSIIQAFLLVSSFGFSRDSLKSNNAVIPIAYYLMTIKNPTNFAVSSATVDNRKKIKKWLTMSLIKRIFSGQPDNVLRPLREIIMTNGNKEFPLDEIINKLRGTSKTLVFTDDDIESLLELQYGRSDTLMILMLLYSSLDYNNKFHVDHIYPKSKFTKTILGKKGVQADRIEEYIAHVNDISNLQMLAAIPNIEKQDKDFDKWYEVNYPTEKDKIQYRKINYLPDMDYAYSDFSKFLDDRRQLLREQLKKELL